MLYGYYVEYPNCGKFAHVEMKLKKDLDTGIWVMKGEPHCRGAESAALKVLMKRNDNIEERSNPL